MLTVYEYISEVKEYLMKLLINNFIPVYSYYSPVNNNQLAVNILRTCYTSNNLEIEKALTNASLVNLVNNNSTIEDNVMVSVEHLDSINILLKD
jgi:hypothetical protein